MGEEERDPQEGAEGGEEEVNEGEGGGWRREV